MTSAAESTPEPRRGRRFVALPFLLLVALAAAWSGGWWWAAGKAGETIDAWLKREADHGRVYACADRRIGGYPFRIEVDCAEPSARIAVEGGEARASAPRFLAVAQVWDPKRVIGELTGPVTFVAPDGRRGELTFSLAQASARADGRRVDRVSVALTTPRASFDGEEVGSAASLEAHLRRAPDQPDGVYDVATTLEGGVSPWLSALPVGAGPVAAEIKARASGLDDFRPGPLSERLKAFAEAGGKVDVGLARIVRGDVAAQATGDLALGTDGRLNGGLDVTARGLDAMVNALLGTDGEDTMSALLGMGAKMLGKKAELDGKPATRYRLKFDKGRVALGPIKLTRLPPAF